MNNIIPSKNRFLLTVKQKSPEILTGVSIAAGIGSLAFSVRAGMKVQAIIDDFKAEIQACQEIHKDEPELIGKEMTGIYGRYIGKIAVLFAPAVGLQATAIVSMLSAKKIVDNRMAIVTSAYAALSTTFNEFVEKFKAKYGEDAYYDLRYSDKVEEYIDVNAENGDAKEIRKLDLVKEVDPNVICIEKGKHPFWMHDEDPASILSMLQAIEHDCDRLLKVDKIVFGNEIRDRLRVPKTEYHQKFGWIYDPNDSNLANKISFDLLHDPESWTNFIKGKDPWIFIKLNCDPHPIWQVLP